MIQGQSLTTSHARLMPHQFPNNRQLTYLTPLLPLFYCWTWHCRAWKISLVTLGHVPSRVLSLPLTNNIFTGGKSEQRILSCCTNAVQQDLKCRSVISTTGAVMVKMTLSSQSDPVQRLQISNWQTILALTHLANPWVLSVWPLVCPSLFSYVTFSEERQIASLSFLM